MSSLQDCGVYIDYVFHVNVMSSRWPVDDRPLRKFMKVAEQLRITIYGSYYPDSERHLLERQRDTLRSAGYPMTNLVSDYPKPWEGATPLEISELCLETSDANFLIFTKNGKNLGVTHEIAYVSMSDSMADRARHCVVFDEVLDNYGTVSTLSMESVKNSGIIRYKFCGEDDLRQGLVSHAYHQVRMQYGTLRGRL